MAMEALLHNALQPPILDEPGEWEEGERRAKSQWAVYGVDSIVRERRRGRGRKRVRELLVWWMGYHPSWEAYRCTETVGGAVETVATRAADRRSAALSTGIG